MIKILIINILPIIQIQTDFAQLLTIPKILKYYFKYEGFFI